MEIEVQRIEGIEHHLDAVAGAQTAIIVALSFLFEAHKLDPQAIAAMTNGLERTRANLLSSLASDYKIEAFDSVAESLLTKLS